MGILISVVVCTYNRAQLLEQALKSLHEQALDPALYEIVVVDNNSSDNTRAVAESFSRRMLNFRYCFEGTQGLSHARNRGWRQARGEYVGYIDDDCKVPAQWLSVAKNIIQQISPAAFGGPYFAFFDTEKPRWFKDSYGSSSHGSKARFLQDDEYLAGGNIVIRKTVLGNLGGFDPNLGMSGGCIAYGEETLLLRRMRADLPGEHIYYDPRLYVYHLVNAEKMSMRWIMRQRFAGGRYAYLTFWDGKPRQRIDQLLARIVKSSVAFVFASSIGVILRNHKQYPYAQNYLCEQAFNNLISLGFAFEQFKNL